MATKLTTSIIVKALKAAYDDAKIRNDNANEIFVLFVNKDGIGCLAIDEAREYLNAHANDGDQAAPAIN